MKNVFRYPLLLIIALVLDRVVVSVTQIDAAQSLRPLLIMLGSASVAAFIVQRFTRDWHRTDFNIFMVMALLIGYRSVYGLFKADLPIYADILALLLIPFMAWLYFQAISTRVWKSIKNPARLTYSLNLIFSFLLIFQLIRFAGYIYQITINSTQGSVSSIPPLAEEIHLVPQSRPDIYVIVLDGYGRHDVLQDIYDYDNSGFLEALKQRGFYVASENHSNYVQTPFAISSLLNFDYIIPWRSSKDYAQYVTAPIQNNRVFQLLKAVGYTTVSFDGSASYTQIRTADVFLTGFVPLNKFEAYLLLNSPFEVLSEAFRLRLPIPSYSTHRSSVLYKLNKVQEIPTLIPGPKITYFHVLIPHPPFVFDENGNPTDPPHPYSIWDGDEYKGTPDEYRAGYRAQVIFINKRILEAIDAILQSSKEPPIIVLMGDHGPGSMFKWDFNDPGCVWERTRNLYAILLPGHRNDGMLYPSISPVNTFRVIFDTYFGAHLDLLDDRTYLMASQYPNQAKDITGTRDSLQGCLITANDQDPRNLKDILKVARSGSDRVPGLPDSSLRPKSSRK